MKNPKITPASLTKRALIDKANTTTVIAAGLATFLVIFSLVASRSLFNQMTYQNRVITEKKQTLSQLEKNLAARDDLVKAYEGFEGGSQNIIGGSTTGGSSDRDGSNSKIVLDALPSKYDFPALTASLEKFAAKQGVEIESIIGIDDEVAQSGQQSSTNPEPVPIDFQVTVRGGYPQIQAFIKTFELSIRPIQVGQIAITASGGTVSANITAQTFYQPEKNLDLRKKVVQ
jgi:hypothetical protein